MKQVSCAWSMLVDFLHVVTLHDGWVQIATVRDRQRLETGVMGGNQVDLEGRAVFSAS